MKPAIALGVTGFSLIAVTYGMARFAWGLMMPAVMKEIPFSVHLAGIVTACSYISYCLSTAAAPWLVARFGARVSACLAALCAAGGLLLLACAFSPLMLAAGLFIAGLSAGVASPAIASAVGEALPPAQQDSANTAINAGTSAGIMLSVPVLLLLPGGWRAACVAFALLALLCLLPARRYLPADRRAGQKDRAGWRGLIRQRSLLRLAIVAFISGSASAAWWSFGPDILRHHLHLDARTSSLLWLIGGGAGIAGALTGAARPQPGADLSAIAALHGAAAAAAGESGGLFMVAVSRRGAGRRGLRDAFRRAARVWRRRHARGAGVRGRRSLLYAGGRSGRGLSAVRRGLC